ncbi:Trm112 family protein [Neisseriaceae bacterium PsAf]|nr:Trm112 family protein [Neisseriaceae bacterium PsAf]MCV2503271.1 Trm112 family protein [Neisseriaceae bacterium]
MDKELFEILVCPITKGKLIYQPETQELISKQIKLAFPIRDGIPILLESEARTISQEEYDALG